MWLRDADGIALDLAENIAREASQSGLNSGGLKDGAARTIASHPYFSAIEKIARFRRSLRSKPNDWDRQPSLIRTPDGVVDIEHDGCRLDPKRGYGITPSTAVAPAATSDGATL